jgi:hypothetical protein
MGPASLCACAFVPNGLTIKPLQAHDKPLDKCEYPLYCAQHDAALLPATLNVSRAGQASAADATDSLVKRAPENKTKTAGG